MKTAKRLLVAMMLTMTSEGVVAQTPAPESAEASTAKPWHVSKYGPADRIGAANNLSPETTRRAARLVKTGKTYELGVKTGPSTPAFGNSRTYTVERLYNGDPTRHDGSDRVTAFDERVTTSMGIGTQIDGLAHLGVDNHAYNGVTAEELSKSFALHTADIPPFVTRGVLIDMARHFEVEALSAGQAFNEAEIKAAAAAQGVKIRKGDVVLFHTGWMGAKMASAPDEFRSRQPGLGEGGAIYLAGLGVVAVGADTVALEAIPFEDPAKVFVVHQTLLAKTGVYILETVDTRELAKDRAKEFMFVAAAPRFEGTVQIVVNPVAIR
ncbi:cyclase family protein [bacterium]|nr:cyclase family protein [bacterium]